MKLPQMFDKDKLEIVGILLMAWPSSGVSLLIRELVLIDFFLSLAISCVSSVFSQTTLFLPVHICVGDITLAFMLLFPPFHVKY